MPEYVGKAELNELVRSAQTNDNQPCLRLIEVARLMGEGLWSRFRYPFGDEEEAVSEAYTVLLRVIPKMNPDANCFSYLTTCLKNHYAGLSQKQSRHTDILNRLLDAARSYDRRGKRTR